jgi:8-oxo-dGTP pyrophosphatase MutT (NUDIX family)
MSLLSRLLEHYSTQNILSELISPLDDKLDSSARPAAVLIPVTDLEHAPEVVLTRRAKHLSTHAGQISFPGGMWEPQDADLSDTALRESWEEVGLNREEVKIVARFAPRESRFGVQVTPFLGVIPSAAKLTPSIEETDQIISVPLLFFMEKEPRRIDYKERGGRVLRMPSWHFEDHEIWGLTAMIIDEMLEPLR